ncbi:MAG: hypothetical protein CVT76_07610 [Alphaproteobacteria bacterium HGW-Alphaproteobacteria-15]|nr:MAG: hypothetical protein CVT76_07610 [Alphaproteobacteria bacterium HGW-Alphaproteobacteria-15]
MLDARFVRENADAVRKAMADRNAAWDIEGFFALDALRRELIGKVEKLQARRNEASKQIGQVMKEARPDVAESLKEEVRSINAEVAVLEEQSSAVDAQVRELLARTGADPARIKQGGDHAGGGGFAMRARHRDGGFEPHQFSQHFRAAHHRDAVFQRGGDFGIGAAHCGGGDDDRRALHILTRVADMHGNTARAQAFNARPFGDVAALHGIAKVAHNLGNAGHPDPADADEVDGADIGADALHRTPPVKGVVRAS